MQISSSQYQRSFRFLFKHLNDHIDVGVLVQHDPHLLLNCSHGHPGGRHLWRGKTCQIWLQSKHIYLVVGIMYNSYRPLPVYPGPATACPCQSNPGRTESKMEIEIMDLVEAFYLINLLEQERLLQRISLLWYEDALHVPDNEWIANCLPTLITLCRIIF